MVLELAPAKAIQELIADLGLSKDDIARSLDTDLRTLGRWRSGQHYPQHEARGRLAALVALRDHLRDTFTSGDAIRAWLHDSSRYLGGLTPLDALRAGRIDRAEAALEALDSGTFM